MGEFLFNKIVDKSLLKSGLTVPKNIQSTLLKNIGLSLNKGERQPIQIIIDQNIYEATLTNVDFSEGITNREVVQIRYAEGSPICKKLKEIFFYSEDFLANKEEGETNLSELERETVEVFSIGKETLEFRCFPKIANGMKSVFLAYLGKETDLSGYQRSYKLVFYKYFFELIGEGREIAAYTLTQYFKKYYVDRKKAGLMPDVNVDSVINNIETSTLESVFDLIKRNPFAAINKKGFVELEEKNGKSYFVLNPQLHNELKADDIDEILRIVNKKLDLYFSKIDNYSEKTMGLSSVARKILNDYIPAKKEVFAGHEMGAFFRNEIPNIIYQTGLVDPGKYLVTGSVGQGNWAMVPWVCIFNRNITVSATKGVYIVYLLSKDGQTLYLTFNQGCTDIRNQHSKKETLAIMRKKANDIIEQIDSRGFACDENINLGNGLTELAELYQKGVIFYKAYHKDDILHEIELLTDLKSMLEIYDEYVSKINGNTDEWWPTKEEYHPGITKDQWVELLKKPEVFNSSRLTMMAQFYSLGGQASCVQLEKAFGKSSDYYRMACGVHLAERISKETGCPLCNQENAKFWPVLFVGRDAKAGEVGTYIWKLRDELKKALEEVSILQYLDIDGGEELSNKEIVANIINYIAAKGFTYDDNLIKNFYLSLKSKPFVILAGTSGTGKTKLVKLFAEAINAEYKLVPVRPDWSDSSDLFGHVDLNGKFIPGAILKFIKDAHNHPNKPYFLCLDEMNLARVEYYLSDFLSVIETREQKDGRIASVPLVDYDFYGKDTEAQSVYNRIEYPQNLYVIGTVNMDETTFPFSRKVLDRANTIEFSYVDLIPKFDDTEEIVSQTEADNGFLKTEYLLLKDCMDESEAVDTYCSELQSINNILQKASAHVGYRVRDEIVFYLLNNKKNDLIAENEAMDNEIMQKILPRIQGSSSSVKNMLCDLFKHCAGDYDGYQTQSDDVNGKMRKVLNDSDRKIKYRRSAEKIELMMRRFEEDGFTSYWL